MALPGIFTVEEAREVLVDLLPVLDRIVAVRADARELGFDLADAVVGRPGRCRLGGLPELKAAQARLDELLALVQSTGAELKGIGPLLVDFPADLDGVPVKLCWIESERSLDWFHRADLGFAGRRRLR